MNDIKIGNRSQFVQSRNIPGEMFSTNAIDTLIFNAIEAETEVVVQVTYVGPNTEGAQFFAAIVGRATKDTRVFMYLVADDHLFRIEIVKHGPLVAAHDVLDLGPCTSQAEVRRFPERVVEIRRVPAEAGFGLYGVDEEHGQVVLQLGVEATGGFVMHWAPNGWTPGWLAAA